MPSYNLYPNVLHYTSYIVRLLIEGDREAALDVYQNQMPAAGVEPNSSTRMKLTLDDDELGRMRTALLERWLSFEGLQRQTSKRAAFDLVDRLIDTGQANIVHVNMLLKNCCYSSGQMRRLLADVRKRSKAALAVSYADNPRMAHACGPGTLSPNAATYTLLARQYVIERKYDKARRVVHEEMVQAGVEADAGALKVVGTRDAKNVSQQKTALLLLCKRDGGDRAHRSVWDLIDRYSNRTQYHIALSFCLDAAEIHALIFKQKLVMPQFATKPVLPMGSDRSFATPDHGTYGLLINALLLEGQVDAARSILANNFSRPDAELTPSIKRSAETSSKKKAPPRPKWLDQLVIQAEQDRAGGSGGTNTLTRKRLAAIEARLARRGAAEASAVTLVWQLHHAGVATDEMYKRVVDHLAANSSAAALSNQATSASAAAAAAINVHRAAPPGEGSRRDSAPAANVDGHAKNIVHLDVSSMTPGSAAIHILSVVLHLRSRQHINEMPYIEVSRGSASPVRSEGAVVFLEVCRFLTNLNPPLLDISANSSEGLTIFPRMLLEWCNSEYADMLAAAVAKDAALRTVQDGKGR